MRRLSQGMEIDAAIEANLLGIRLLTLKSKITALPASHLRPIQGHRFLQNQSRQRVIDHRPLSNGVAPDNTLAKATKSLEASAADLAAARQNSAAEGLNGDGIQRG